MVSCTSVSDWFADSLKVSKKWTFCHFTISVHFFSLFWLATPNVLKKTIDVLIFLKIYYLSADKADNAATTRNTHTKKKLYLNHIILWKQRLFNRNIHVIKHGSIFILRTTFIIGVGPFISAKQYYTCKRVQIFFSGLYIFHDIEIKARAINIDK